MEAKHKGDSPDNRIETTTLSKQDNFINKADFTNDKNYEENDADDFEDDKMYEDTPVQMESVDAKVEFRKRLLDIPFEKLPCPHRLVHKENAFSLSAQDEIKYFNPSSTNKFNLSFKTIVLFSVVLILL